MSVNLTLQQPKAVQRLGSDLFLELPLYEAKIRYRALYINAELFQQVFNDTNTDFAHMAEIIERQFSTTLDHSKSNGVQVGYAYVDRQADPLKLSLNDNLGSGRAYYQDYCFNIKGEKTPLAVSKRDQYSNGILELEKALFETIASNSLFGDLNIQLTPILAVLDIHEDCTVYWKTTLCKRAKIIRVDQDGSLDRITHIFQAQRPLKHKALLRLAHRIGILEGEKFLHRIQHGAWSAGNLSGEAHLIDFDTVCAVRYRAPQYSFCRWFIDNYFGQEYHGQLKILRSLVEEEAINLDGVSYGPLKKQLLTSRQTWIETQFPKLMGFNRVDAQFMPAIRRLVKQFMHLSTKCYPVPDELELKFMESQFCAPFNFSRFFRFYPLLRRSGQWSVQLGLQYLVDCVRDLPDFDLETIEAADADEAFFNRTVLHQLDDFFIHSKPELFQLTLDCTDFIKAYHRLFTRLLKAAPQEAGAVETRAYIMNQDRLRLFMPHSIAGPIDDERQRMPYETIHHVIHYTILSNKRNGQQKLYGLALANMAIFKEGFFATLHNHHHQHKLCLSFYPGLFQPEAGDRFSVEINGERYPCRVKTESNGLVFLLGPWCDNLNLQAGEYETIAFYCNDALLVMNNFIFAFTELPKVDNFAVCLD